LLLAPGRLLPGLIQQGKWVGAGDEPGAPLAGEVVPGPLGQHQQLVVEADQVADVNEDPHQPGREAAETGEGTEQLVPAPDLPPESSRMWTPTPAKAKRRGGVLQCEN